MNFILLFIDLKLSISNATYT